MIPSQLPFTQKHVLMARPQAGSFTPIRTPMADAVHFAGKEKLFSNHESDEIAQIIARCEKAANKASKVKLHKRPLGELIQQGKPLPVTGQYVFGVLTTTGEIKSPSDKFQKIISYLKPHIPQSVYSSKRVPIVIEIRNDQSFDAVKDYLKKELIPIFQMEGEVTIRKGLFSRVGNRVSSFLKRKTPEPTKNIKVLESSTWPFFRDVIAGEPLPDKVKGLSNKLLELPFYRLYCPSLSKAQDAAVHQAFNPLRLRLAAVEAARMQYAEQVNMKEVMSSLAKGAAVGGGGETLVHFLMPDNSGAAGAVRAGLLVAVDTIDNVYGEMGVLHSDLEANGMHFSRETIFGTNSKWQITKNIFKSLFTFKGLKGIFKGKGGIFAQRAASSAVKGAAIGAGMAVPVGFTLSDPNASPLMRAAVGGPGTFGTSAAIPVNIRATMPQVYYTVRHLMDEGKINVPPSLKEAKAKLDEQLKASNMTLDQVLADQGQLTPELKKAVKTAQYQYEQAKHAYCEGLATQELLSRLGFSASMKAFSMVPISGGILALELVGVPREAVQIAFMGMAPAMENLLRLGVTLTELKTLDKRMNTVEDLILSKPETPLNEKEKNRVARKFADGWSKTVCWLLTRLPVKSQIKIPVAMNVHDMDQKPAVEATVEQPANPTSEPAKDPSGKP